IEVKTDSKGTVLSHAHVAPLAQVGTHFTAQANLGLFDSTGTTADPIPSLARGHNLFDGYLAASGASSSGATNWSGALSGADVKRSERDSDLERATQRLGFEGRVNQTRGDDRFNGLAMYQGHRAPFGFTPGETRERGLVLGAAWRRADVSGQELGTVTNARVTYVRGTTDDPKFGAALPFERLVDGAPQFQAPHNATGQRLQLEASSRQWKFGDSTDASVVARIGRSESGREQVQPTFQALERLNGTSAREWTFTSTAPARVAENRLGFALRFASELSERTRVTGSVELQRVTVGDRDGGRILSSNNILPELRFEWRKSDVTELYAEASIGTPPVPLAGYESATSGVPNMSARRWNDLNGDGRVTSNELGAEVARRGPGSVVAAPDLSLPTMRRVIVGFKTKVFGVGIHATGWARRDVHLIETALNPSGAEVLRTRNIPDPSGDIVGASDDQILPIVEETTASFTSSRYLLTNPAGHVGRGEGAELGFETNSKHVHWGLNGAAFLNSGQGGNRGLRVNENDFGVVGESYDRANTDTFGDGRLFFDRAYSLRMYLTANDVRGFTFGAIGRYDDGQPFARLVIQNDLPQGPDFVQAIPRGRARLHYTLSVDARIARKFTFGNSDIEVSASVFNALGSQFEAEEQVVWQSDYRRITMVQPPRAFVIGVRIGR
ncbi:MAG: hypothetical protein ABI672_18165, partial [Vicinamibacteria bacterium]